MSRKEIIMKKAKALAVKKEMTDVVSRYIQSAVDQYNELNGTAFDSVHNCAAYKDIPTYPHQPFCQSVLEWNAEVWVSARAVETAVNAGEREVPSKTELINELPTFEMTEQ